MEKSHDTFSPKKASLLREEGKAVWVQHSYHDRSQEPPPSHPLNAAEFRPSFPVKLHQILDKLEEDGHSNLVAWQPHGRCFVIHQPREFTSTVLPVYFDGLSKLTSFQRQLNLYGFKRITQGRDKGGYYHEYFLKGKAYLAHKIPRQKVKGTGVRGKPNPDQEPDLWALPWVASVVNGDINEEIAPQEKKEEQVPKIKEQKDPDVDLEREKEERDPEKIRLSSSCSSLVLGALSFAPLQDKEFLNKEGPSANSATQSLQELWFHYSQKHALELERCKVEESFRNPLRQVSAFSPLPLPPRLSAAAPTMKTGPAKTRFPPMDVDVAMPSFCNWMSQEQGASLDPVVSLEDYIYSLEEAVQAPHVSVSPSPSSGPETTPSCSLLPFSSSFTTLNDPLLGFLDEAIMAAGRMTPPPSWIEEDGDDAARFPIMPTNTTISSFL